MRSFKKGIAALARMDAQAFSVYSLVWLKNVGYNEKQEDYRVVTLNRGDPNGTAKTVIQTADVSFRECVEGLMYTNAAQLLHGCRSLYHTCAIVEAWE